MRALLDPRLFPRRLTPQTRVGGAARWLWGCAECARVWSAPTCHRAGTALGSWGGSSRRVRGLSGAAELGWGTLQVVGAEQRLAPYLTGPPTPPPQLCLLGPHRPLEARAGHLPL